MNCFAGCGRSSGSNRKIVLFFIYMIETRLAIKGMNFGKDMYKNIQILMERNREIRASCC